MNVLLELLYRFITKKAKYKHGWRQYIIYPFIWLWYRYQVKSTVHKYIETPNVEMDFRNTIIEYTSFMTVLLRMLSPDTEVNDINSIIKYKDTTKVFVTYENDKVKSVLYTFTNAPVIITVNVKEDSSLMTMDVKTEIGMNSFSFNSLIDSRLQPMRDTAEQIIRTDISANLRRVLIDNNY